ncbi:MAG: hypothetical protein HZC37_27385 [Burkholderiales bacterium]|nr:hypothetical protein [Burkholderiales bacterium]
MLDLVFSGSRGAALDRSADWVAPWTELGQVVAATFDRGMTPAEWATLSRPPADPVLQIALRDIWHHEVLKAFADSYGFMPAP